MREFSIAVKDAGEVIRATAFFPGVPAERVLASFTVPAELAKWWGGELCTELTVGGGYTVRFAKPGVTMAGEIVRYRPPSDLEFTWRWEHAPNAPARTAALSLRTCTEGTALVIVHGPFGTSDAEIEDRAGVREGWEHFLPRLAASLVP